MLTGEDPVFTWVSGTGARPTLQALPPDLRADFEAEFKQRLAEAYPVTTAACCSRSAASSWSRASHEAPPRAGRLPPGGEDVARRFYADGLGLTEVAKPAELAGRGGAWFRSPTGAEIHVGVEDPFTPARKAHPALLVDDLDAVARRLRDLGFEVD